MKEKIMKKQIGITLIALIITIIIMLILVAVTVKVLVDTDIIGATKTAADRWQNETDKEREIGSKFVIDGVEYDSIEDYVNNKTSQNINITLSLIHEDIPVTADGTKVVDIVDGVPIPAGFVASGATGENTKDGGLVIYAGSDPVNDSNVATAQIERNQFVWIPVLQNQKIKIEVTSEENIDSIILKDPWNDEMTIPSASGNTYTAEIEPEINGLYTVTIEAGEDTATKTLRVSSLYAQDFWQDYYFEDFFFQAHGYGSQEEMTEGWELWEYDSFEELVSDWFTYGDWVKRATDETIQTYKNSVNLYGGFYIARYEAGIDENGINPPTPRNSSIASNISAAAVSKKNKLPYNWITQPDAITKSNEIYNTTSVKSCLMSAAAWDRTLNWLVEINAKNSSLGVTRSEMFANGENWGNTYFSTFELDGYYSEETSRTTRSFTNGTATKPENSCWLLGTGVSDYTKRNNIYDFSGNVWEWTTEKSSNSGLAVYRGGAFGDDFWHYPHNRYFDDPSYSWQETGFRFMLYINL